MKREDFHYFLPITTRWMDNDLYGHVNNVVYYAYFDTVANTFLIEQGGLDIHRGEIIGLVVNSQCSYREAVAFPDQLQGGLRVNRIGNSSVQWGIGIFKAGNERASAHGTFTHVFVERETRSPTPIPAPLRRVLASLTPDQCTTTKGSD